MTILPDFGLMLDTHFAHGQVPLWLTHCPLCFINRNTPVAPCVNASAARCAGLFIMGLLALGNLLPSSRVLAEDLGVSRVTTEAAYAQLEAEGYLQRRVGQGTFVAINIVKSPPAAKVSGEPHLSQRGTQIAQTGGCHDPLQPLPFAAGSPDLRAFPLKLWKQLTAQQLRLRGEALMRYGDPQGYFPLREAIAGYVSQTRGVNCDAQQIVVLTSSQQALQLITHPVG